MDKQGISPIYDTDICLIGTIGIKSIGEIDTGKFAVNDLVDNHSCCNYITYVGNIDIETLWSIKKEKS